MAILSSDELFAHFPELRTLALDKQASVLLNANVYVAGQVILPDPVPADLKLAAAMIAKDMSRERNVTAVKQGDYQESFSYRNNNPEVERILAKYRLPERRRPFCMI